MASELYLTEYERERQKKIEENKRLLETLGIFETRSVLDASTLSVDVPKPKRNYVKRARVPLEPRRSERVSIRPQATSYAESDDSGTESDKPKSKNVQGIRKLNSYFSVRKTMWKPFYGQEIATCHICLVRNRQPKTKCSRCYADFWRGHVCRGCYEANFTGDDIESFDEARENPNWVCFVCRGICTCKFCRVGSTKRGKRYTKKRPLEEEEALALAQGQQLQIKEERDSDDGQNFLPRKRGRGRPPKTRLSDPTQPLLMGSDPGDEDDQFDHPLFEGQLDHHYHQLDQLEQLEQLQEQLSQLEQLDQLEQIELAEREQERMRQEQLAMAPDPTHLDALAHVHGQVMPQVPLKRGRGRPPKNPQQQQYKRQKYQKHELHHKLQKPRQGRRKSLNEYSDVIEDKHDAVQVKQEPLLDDILGHDPSLLHDQMLQDHMLHDHMLMLPEQPMLHEHILQDIPPLQEHPLQLPMLHSQSLQDVSQDHSMQDQLFREHSTFQQPYHNSFIHHTHHPHHNHTHSHTTTSSLGAPSYSSHDSFVPHSTASHFSVGNHHNHHHSANSILNSTTPTSLLLDNSLYQHPYFFQNYYYPQNHELHELQQQQQMQQEQQQQEMHRQEMHRQEMQRQREMHHREVARQEEDELSLSLSSRQHELRNQLNAYHHSTHHHLLHTDFINQDSEPEHRGGGGGVDSRDVLHPSSILSDPSSNSDDYHDSQDHSSYQSHFQSGMNSSYETMRDHSPSSHHENEHPDYLAQIHEQDSPLSSQNALGPLSSHHDSLPVVGSHSLDSMHNHSQGFKQEYQHHDLQQRDHYDLSSHHSPNH